MNWSNELVSNACTPKVEDRNMLSQNKYFFCSTYNQAGSKFW